MRYRVHDADLRHKLCPSTNDQSRLELRKIQVTRNPKKIYVYVNLPGRVRKMVLATDKLMHITINSNTILAKKSGGRIYGI